MSRTTVTLTIAGIAAVAAAAGCAAGVLLAPASGSETRRRLSRRLADESYDLKRACGRALDGAVTAAKHEIERRMSCREEARA